MPVMPTRGCSSGPSTSDSRKLTAIEPPIIAIALVRWESRVPSATIADTAADTAPAPCNARPMMTVTTESSIAAMKLPSANTSSPPTITGLRPSRSEATPSGNCSSAWVSP